MSSKTRSAKRAREKAQEDGHVVVTTTREHDVLCLPIATLIDEVRASYQARMDELERPHRVMRDVAKSEIQVEYTDESILKEDVPDEHREAYAAYKLAEAELASEMNESVFRAVAVRGIRVLTMPDEEEWTAEHEWLGIAVPGTPHERAFHFFKSEVIGGKKDGIDIIAGIYRASGIDEEVLSKLEETFRAEVGRAEGADAGGDTEDAGEAEEAEARGLVEQPGLHDSQGEGEGGP